MMAFETKRCFLFDLDGTLLDSSTAHARSFLAALGSEHPEIAASFDYERVRGLDTETAFRRLGIGEPSTLSRLIDQKRAHYRELVTAGEVSLFPFAIELLEALHRADRTLLLVTSASRRAAELVLAKKALAEYFACVITADDVSATKPSPEPFLRALSKVVWPPSACLTIEDTLGGIEGSRRANIDAVLVHDVDESVPSFPSLLALHESLRLESRPAE